MNDQNNNIYIAQHIYRNFTYGKNQQKNYYFSYVMLCYVFLL